MITRIDIGNRTPWGGNGAVEEPDGMAYATIRDSEYARSDDPDDCVWYMESTYRLDPLVLIECISKAVLKNDGIHRAESIEDGLLALEVMRGNGTVDTSGLIWLDCLMRALNRTARHILACEIRMKGELIRQTVDSDADYELMVRGGSMKSRYRFEQMQLDGFEDTEPTERYACHCDMCGYVWTIHGKPESSSVTCPNCDMYTDSVEPIPPGEPDATAPDDFEERWL